MMWASLKGLPVNKIIHPGGPLNPYKCIQDKLGADFHMESKLAPYVSPPTPSVKGV